VRSAVACAQLPVVLAGSCNASLGVLAGFDHSRCGAVWLDAHADFNSPDSTASGFFPGMSVAIITGHCYRDYWAQIGDNTPLGEESASVTSRPRPNKSASKAQASRLSNGTTDTQTGTSSPPSTTSRAAYATSTCTLTSTRSLSSSTPAIADEPVPGGLTLEQAETVIRGTADRFRIRAATLATHAPERDREERTLQVALSVIELLADYASNTDDGRDL